MKKRKILICLFVFAPLALMAQKGQHVKPRIIISTDIGGTDPDDFQSMIHFLMYSNMFQTEGLISSPSYGHGTKQDILDMIALYEKDLPWLKRHAKGYPSPDILRAVCKQGRQGAAPFKGYLTATEGSDWIIQCAEKKSSHPLWILCWGGLDDLAQALHDAPQIQGKIRVYWIGGPNKKWSANSYAYIAANFPNLWFIECNSSFNGFFLDKTVPDSLKDRNYYNRYIHGAGYLGKDFKKYYGGTIKMGDTPSLLYMMDGNPDNPSGKSWGGSFVKLHHSPRRIYYRKTTLKDTVPVYAVLEFHFKGPRINVLPDSSSFTMTVLGKIGKQTWPGYYLGNGNYAIRYCPKQAETLTYKITSTIHGFPEQSGQFVVANTWPGKPGPHDYLLGSDWYTDCPDPKLFLNDRQGARTIFKWRNTLLLNWVKRWAWLQ